MAKIVPLADARLARGAAVPHPAAPFTPTGALADTRGRMLRDLRVSVTDRCNFRCVYCMPKDVFGHEKGRRIEFGSRLCEGMTVFWHGDRPIGGGNRFVGDREA